MPTDSELLTTLREAARQRDWNGCRNATEALLAHLPVPTMLRIAREELTRRLPLFEHNHPHMRWPRVWLNALATGEPFTFDESTPEVLEEAPGPGGNSFTEGVRQLALATAAEGEKCGSHAITAISRAIMSERTEAGGSKHRELWDRWFQEALTTQEDSYSWVLETIAREPEAVAVELAAWNRLADALAAALGVKG